MDKRFGYDSGSSQQAMQAALEMEEALYLRRQQELQRDIQIQRMLLREQLDQQSLLGTSAAPSPASTLGGSAGSSALGSSTASGLGGSNSALGTSASALQNTTSALVSASASSLRGPSSALGGSASALGSSYDLIYGRGLAARLREEQQLLQLREDNMSQAATLRRRQSIESSLPQGSVPQSTLERHLTTISKAPISAAARQELTTEAIVADSLAANAMLRNEAAKNKLIRTESTTKRKRSVSETSSSADPTEHIPPTKQRRDSSGGVMSDRVESNNTVKVPPSKSSKRRGKSRTDLPNLPVNAGGVVRKLSPSTVPKEDAAAKGLAEMATSSGEDGEQPQQQWPNKLAFGMGMTSPPMKSDGNPKSIPSSDSRASPSMSGPSPREGRPVSAPPGLAVATPPGLALAASPLQHATNAPASHHGMPPRPLPSAVAKHHVAATHRPPPPSKHLPTPKQRPTPKHHSSPSPHPSQPTSHMYYPKQGPPPREHMEWENYEAPVLQPIIVKGTVDDLVKAAERQDKVDEVIAIMRNLKDTAVPWSDSEDEEEYDETKEDVIVLPGFKSKIPSLPVEPEYVEPVSAKDKGEAEGSAPKHKTSIKAKKATTGMTVDYPYAVDNWWPSVSSIRKERRADGEKSDEEDFTEEPKLSTEVPAPTPAPMEEKMFRANAPAIRKRLATSMEPGVLEKLPHCRIHRMAMRQMKVASAPDHAFCWQVTENYSHEPMVCCSVCNTWRHASCGGHYKAVTIRDTMNEPFVPVCDRCHEEKKFLKDQKQAQIRLESQRVEHLRRTLQTTAVIRHAAFAKHAGTNKWPLGSVNPSHLAAHTRSVQSRHDKSEKLWADMANKLSGKGVGSRPKDRIKGRSRELERLLTSVEDAENETDRHNMMLFLQLDSSRRHPIGFEKRRRNIFDPADDDLQTPASLYVPPVTPPTYLEETDRLIGRGVTHRRSFTGQSPAPPLKCAREGCLFRPRFDSVFCSDACGVSALELDLYKSLQYASHMHPHTLRA